MDWEYLHRELEAMGLAEFEARMRTLSRTVFAGEKEPDEQEKEILYYLLGSGTYGNLTTNVEHKLEQFTAQSGMNVGKAKFKYLMDRVFVSEESCKSFYPFFYKHRYFRPFLFPYRVIRGLIVHPAHLWREWKVLKKIK